MQRLQKKNECLREIIQLLTQQNGITVDEDLHGDLQFIMNEFNDQVRGENAEGTFQHTFWDQQLQASKIQDSRQIRWHHQLFAGACNSSYRPEVHIQILGNQVY